MFLKPKRHLGLLAAVLVIALALAACGSKTSPAYEIVAAANLTPGSPIPAPSGEVVLTITGDIDVKNVGDTLQFDMATLEGLGLVKYTVDDPWLNATNTYTGILMSGLREFVGSSDSAGNIHIVALDDYAVDLAVADVEKWPILLATRTNGAYMNVEDAGPTRIIYPYHKYSIDPLVYNDLWIWNLASIEMN